MFQLLQTMMMTVVTPQTALGTFRPDPMDAEEGDEEEQGAAGGEEARVRAQQFLQAKLLREAEQQVGGAGVRLAGMATTDMPGVLCEQSASAWRSLSEVTPKQWWCFVALVASSGIRVLLLHHSIVVHSFQSLDKASRSAHSAHARYGS